VLDELATQLSLRGRTPMMGEVFDRFAANTSAIHDAMQKGRPRHYTLWRKPDLVARLRAGQQIPGFTLDGEDVAISLNVSFDAPAGTPPEQLASAMTNAWSQLVWPVNIGQESPAADIDASLRSLDEFRRAIAGAEAASVMTVLHETVESTLVSQFLHSADRRWFCEGIANHLALQVIRKRVGEERAKQYFDIDVLLAEAGKGDLTELERWPAAESSDASHYPSEINQANYVRATWVIGEIVRKHGAGFVPRWLAAIGKTPLNQASMRTVNAAFRDLTREDLSDYLKER
jgi:hypothetical protein